ncbi:MAG: hypothetical protein KKC18_06775, partial [Chloroflexi bacterium]|nr:hypothetical protein [Chloroflexota bacterium]
SVGSAWLGEKSGPDHRANRDPGRDEQCTHRRDQYAPANRYAAVRLTADLHSKPKPYANEYAAPTNTNAYFHTDTDS